MKSNLNAYLCAITFALVFSCTTDEIYEPFPEAVIPENLLIDDVVGIKLESHFASENVDMNVKLNTTGTYYIKIISIDGTLVSKEKVKGSIGDNLFKVYTKTLPKNSYKLELYLEDTKVGYTSINLI